MAVIVGRAGPDTYNVLDAPWSVQTGASPSDPTANTEAINAAIVAAQASERSVLIPDRVGVNGSIVAKPTVTIKGGSRVVRKSTLAQCTGSWLFFSGTVAPKTPLLKIGDAAQTEQFDNVLIENIGLWGDDKSGTVGVSIRSNGLLLTPTYRTKGIEFRGVCISTFPFTADIGPPPTATTFATSTAYVANQFVKPITPNGRIYRCTVAGTSAGSSPTWPTTTGDTVVSNTATFMDWGTEETGRLEEQSDDIAWHRCDFWGTSNAILGLTINGANAADAMTSHNCQYFAISAAGNPYLDLINGGYFYFESCYGGGDTSARDWVRVWTPGINVFQSCQAESMRYWLTKPSQASSYELEHTTLRDCYIDSPIYLDQYTRVRGDSNKWGASATLYLNGAQWDATNEYWVDSGRSAYPITLSGVGTYSNERLPKASTNGWQLLGERVRRRTPATATPLYDVVTAGGYQATTWSSSDPAISVGTQRKNTADTRAFQCTALALGTTATGAVAEPTWNTTIGATTVEAGSVNITWTCIASAAKPTTKTGMTLS